MLDKIYCLTLKNRPERTQQATAEFAKHGLSPEFFFGFVGERPMNGLKAGEIGCAISHVRILEDAYNRNFSSVLITEDDVVFVDKWYDKLENTPIPADWGMIYLGGNHEQEPIKVSNEVYKIVKTYTTHAYIISKPAIKIALEIFPREPDKVIMPMDVYYSELQKKIAAYCLMPHLAWQRPGYSDIQEQHVDYAFLREFTNSTSTKKQSDL